MRSTGTSELRGPWRRTVTTKATAIVMCVPGGRIHIGINLQGHHSCHWSSKRPAQNDGKVHGEMGYHDAFDVYCHFEHAATSVKQ